MATVIPLAPVEIGDHGPRTSESFRTRALDLSRSTRRVSRFVLFMLDLILKESQRTNAGRTRTPAQQAQHMRWVAENLCAIHGIRISSRGMIPKGPAVYVANHLSYIDPLAVLSAVPAHAVAKYEVGGWPLIGEAIRTLPILLVDRDCPYSGARVLRRARRVLQAGASVLAFPEGTTTHGDCVLPFRRGMFGIAQSAGVPVVPVTIRYTSLDPCWVGDAAFFPHYLQTTVRKQTHAQMIMSEPIAPNRSLRAQELAEQARQTILAELAAGARETLVA